jgi:hypothetical protein
MIKVIGVLLTGTVNLLMSHDKLADPLDQATIAHKKLTSIRGKAKTDDVHLAIAKSQYINSVYWQAELGPVIPTVNLKKCMEEGAKLSKNGDKVRKGIILTDEYVPLNYVGRPKGKPHTPTDLWNAGTKYLDKRTVVVGKARVMCYRPSFPAGWTLEYYVSYDTEIIEGTWILDFLGQAGAYVGLGGFRPSKNGPFGRFIVEEIKNA